MVKIAIPNYTDVANALKKTDSEFQPAQIHGFFCGIICAAPNSKTIPSEALITGPKKNLHTHEVLEELYAASHQQLSEFSFEFILLLPKNRADINLRTEALGLWCQGFLTGIQHSIPLDTLSLSGESNDALNDIIEIAQVSYGDIAATEENETAYFELVEYIRMAVLMIFHEINTAANPAQNKSRSMH